MRDVLIRIWLLYMLWWFHFLFQNDMWGYSVYTYVLTQPCTISTHPAHPLYPRNHSFLLDCRLSLNTFSLNLKLYIWHMLTILIQYTGFALNPFPLSIETTESEKVCAVHFHSSSLDLKTLQFLYQCTFKIIKLGQTKLGSVRPAIIAVHNNKKKKRSNMKDFFHARVVGFTV